MGKLRFWALTGGSQRGAGPHGLLAQGPRSSPALGQLVAAGRAFLGPCHAGFSTWRLPAQQLASAEQADERVSEHVSETEASAPQVHPGSGFPSRLLEFCSVEAGHQPSPPHSRVQTAPGVTCRRQGTCLEAAHHSSDPVCGLSLTLSGQQWCVFMALCWSVSQPLLRALCLSPVGQRSHVSRVMDARPGQQPRAI